MRTGNLSVQNDGVSGLWFGGGLFQSIGSTNTSLFHVNLAEADATAKWKGGYVKFAGGYAAYDDNDPGVLSTSTTTTTTGTGIYTSSSSVVTVTFTAPDNHRDIYYYYLEALQHVTPKFYGVTRFSQIRAAGGYPIVADSAPSVGCPPATYGG